MYTNVDDDLTLLTDLYQLTMGCGYWRAGIAERRACFHLFFRQAPFDGAYAVTAGLADALDYVEGIAFDAGAREYLGSLRGPDGVALFPPEFLRYLGDLRCTLDVDAMPEGTVAFAHEPLLRIEGPLLQVQLVETALLNMINFQTLIATKAARVCREARGPNGPEPVLEFGLRRAQGVDGAISASRAAFVGGCSATSNVLAGRRFGIPVQGTHAHSWVMAFDTEPEAFARYADSFPGASVFLVDTYDTLEGVRHAIEAGRALRERGHEMVGVRLDSGDLAELSIAARRMLDEAGFPDAAVVASNDLDEHRIAELKKRGARIGVWGVGTRLTTAYDQPALGGVYKLASIQDEKGIWQPRIKLSENPIKRSIPGRLQVRRFEEDGEMRLDAMYDVDAGLCADALVDPEDASVTFTHSRDGRDLLEPVLRGGARTRPDPSLATSRERALAQVAMLPERVARRTDPARYPVGLDAEVAKTRARLSAEARSRVVDRNEGSTP